MAAGDWWDVFTTGVTDYISTGSTGNSFADFAVNSGLGYALNKSGIADSFQPQTPAVGYQGGIPVYDAVRERLPVDDSNRRAGEAGRRYFSDTKYVPQGSSTDNNNNNNNNNNNTDTGDTPNTNEQPPYEPNEGGGATMEMAAGGIASVNQGYYLGGKTDGMADEVPARIDGKQEARLSDGEFVIPADVVSHLGNGNSDAGADQLHGMMSSIRKERTGNPEQGKQIDPNKFMPTMAQGGIAQAYNYGGSVRKFDHGGPTHATDNPAAGVGGDTSTGVDPVVGQIAGTESSLSNWAGDYVTDMLGQGKALGNQAYQGYEGPLSAGTNTLQDQSFTGIGGLQAPTGMGAFTPQTFGAEQAEQYMNPYLMQSLNPQLDEARRQSEIDRVANAGRMTQAGAFGGSRQALMDIENTRNLQSNLADITGQGYASAYDRAQQQFNTEQGLGMQAQNASNQYGFDVLNRQGIAGAEQRGIESEGMAADYAQFKEERDYPYKQVQYMQSLLQGLPLEAQTTSYNAPSDAAQLAGTMQTIEDIYNKYGGGGGSSNTSGSGGTNPSGKTAGGGGAG